MGRLSWRHGRSRAPFRPWRAVHRPRVRHRGRGIRHASPDRHGRRLVRQRHGRERRRNINGKQYVYTHPTDIKLEGGKYTVVNLIVGRDEITLGNVSIADWGEGENINGGEAQTD